MDQRRADTLVDLLLGRADPPAVTLQVIAPADTITGAIQMSPGGCPAWDRSPPPRSAELIGSDGAEGSERASSVPM